MRAIVVGPLAKWSVADVARGWVSGLREVGVDTAYFNLSAQLAYFRFAEVNGNRMSDEQSKGAVTLNLLGEAYQLDPDVVFIVTGNDVDPQMVRQLKCPVVLVLTECPYELEGQALLAAEMEPDLILVNDPLGAEVFNQVAPTFYSPHCYDPKVHHADGRVQHFDSVFVGTGFPNRIEFLESVDWSGIRLALGGMWTGCDDDSPLLPFVVQDDPDECVDNAVTSALYRSSATGFNIYRADSYGEHSTADGIACGPREIELAACGTWFARDARPESDELFPMLPTFTDPGELGDLIRWALAHPDERQEAADAARAAVADRTFAANATRALKRLNL